MTRAKWQANIDLCDSTDDVSEAFYIFEEASRQYISSLEAKIAELETRVKDSDDNCYELSQHIAELEAPKRCIDCKYSTQHNRVLCMCEHFGKVKVNHFCSYYEPKDSK